MWSEHFITVLTPSSSLSLYQSVKYLKNIHSFKVLECGLDLWDTLYVCKGLGRLSGARGNKEIFVTNLPSRVKSLLNENGTPIYRRGLGLRTMDTLPASENGFQGFNILFWRRLRVDVCCRLEGAQEAAAAAQRAGRDWPPSAMGQPPNQPVKGPSSLFLLSEDNPLRRYTRFIIEWPYPFIRNVQHFKMCRILYKTHTTYPDVKF